MMLIVLICLRKYLVLLWNKKKVLIMLLMKTTIHSRNYISFDQKTFDNSILEWNYGTIKKKYGTILHKVSIKHSTFLQ